MVPAHGSRSHGNTAVRPRRKLPAHFASLIRRRPMEAERALLDVLIVAFWAGMFVTMCTYVF